MTAPADFIFVLHSANNKHAAKQFGIARDGTLTTRGYAKERFFRVERVELDSFEALAETLSQVTAKPFAFLIRGAPLPTANLRHTRRLLHREKKTGDEATFQSAPHHWFAIDLDRIPAPALTDPASDPDDAIEYLIGLLPREIHDAQCWWQLTSSQGLPGHTDSLSGRLWFWAEEQYSDEALKRWAIAANRKAGFKLIDPVLYSAVQAHYTATPLFSGKLTDPLPRRWGIREGLEKTVALIIPPPDAKDPGAPGAAGYEPGIGVAAHLAQIGGPEGFRIPIRRAIASYIATYGSNADVQPLYRAIRKRIKEVEPDGLLGRYEDDEHLDKLVEWIRNHHGDRPGKGFIAEPPDHIADPEIPINPTQNAAPDANGGRVIRVRDGERHLAADQGLAALQTAGVAFYRRDRGLARVCLVKAKTTDGEDIMVPGIMPVTPAILCRALGQAARWEKITRKLDILRIDPPDKVVEQILNMIGQWPFPPLAGVITSPTLRPDGSLLSAEGYDEATGLVLHNGVTMPPIPGRPTRDDADAAILRLTDLLVEFPFANEASKSVALSLLMTPVLRGAFPVAPMHLTNAPEAGTGKSYLADIASTIATGERCAVIAVAPNPEETEKRLIGAALAGYPIIALDNVRGLLEGDFLCQVTERPLLQLRRLGSSDQIRVVNTFTMIANGNNAAVIDDLVRRNLTATLDANVECPEKRTFTANPLATVLRNRGIYIAAILTIARAYIAAGRPSRLNPLPSYEGWSDLVRSALVWLGYPDPAETIEAARGADPVREDRAAVVAAWRDELTVGDGYLAADIVELAQRRNEFNGDFVRPQLHAALLAVAAQRGTAGTKIDARRLGIWLKRNENTIALKHKLTVDRTDSQRPRWSLLRLAP